MGRTNEWPYSGEEILFAKALRAQSMSRTFYL